MVDVDALVARARTAPRQVRIECERHLRNQELEPAERAALFMALGWAAFTQGETLAAADALAGAKRYVAHGHAVLDPTELVRLESAVLIEQGRTELAASRITTLLEAQQGRNRSRLWSGLGAARSASGDFEAAIASYDEGLEDSRKFSDRFSELILLNNRAVAFLELGQFDAAATDLVMVKEASMAEGRDYLYTISTHNLGVGEARRGHLATAIGLFAEASELLTTSGDLVSYAHALTDQSRLFLDAGLLDEAFDAATRSLAIFEQLDSASRCADVLVVQARVRVAEGNWRAAADLATEALHRAPASSGSRAVELAHQLIYSCELVGGVHQVAPNTERLRLLGSNEADLAVDAAVALADQGRTASAVDLLRPLAQASAEASTLIRLHHAVASAVLAALEHRHSDALVEVVRGLELARDSAVALGVSDLRVMTERRVRQLRDTGVEIEFQHGTPAGIVKILEMARAIVLTPEPDLSGEELTLLTQVRSLAKSVTERSLTGPNMVAVTERRNRLERDLRDLRRARVLDLGAADQESHESSHGLADVTVHLFARDDLLHAVVTRPHGAPVVVELGELARARRTLGALRMTLAARAAAGSVVDPTALVTSLANQFEPLVNELRADTLVAVVPESSLDHIPWSLLLQVPVTIGPSQQLLEASARGIGDQHQHVVVVAGPDLAYATSEVEAIGGAYSEAVILEDAAANSDMVRNYFSTARVLHFASHGTFRADNPLYSSVRLGDGPLTLFDLLGSGVPAAVVFSSCDVGRSAVASSLGLASLLLSRGCRSVVASTGPVNDRAAADLMAIMHRYHSAGESMAASLYRAQVELIPLDPSVALFAAYGVG